MAEHFPCGILHGKGTHAPDDDGCLLPNHHEGPHEYIARDGVAWQWETNLECDCEWCMRCEGDYCTIYWRKADSRGEVEFQSWLARLREVEPHYRTLQPEGAKWRPHCTCGWKGRLSGNMDQAGGQHATHRARLSAASDLAAAGLPAVASACQQVGCAVLARERSAGVMVTPATLSDERILHLWDTHVAYETNPNRPKQPPLGDKDKLAFARAVLAAHGLAFPQNRQEK